MEALGGPCPREVDMNTKVLLPRLVSFKVSGASPVFRSDIEREVTSGINFILGGNGLGKTTTIQALVFALSGGITKHFEPDRSFRWNHKWFSGRVDPDNASSAFVEIEFYLGQRRIGIRRQFSSSAVSAVKLADSSEWITDKPEAASALANELAVAGFSSVDDFAFVVHRLLYLAEDRRAIAWDASAQVRLLMLLSPEAISEEQFRKSRENLKRVDSSRRHAHVAVGKLQSLLGQKAEPPKPRPNEVPQSVLGTDDQDESEVSATAVLESLERAISARAAAEQVLQELDRSLGQRSNEVDQLRAQIDAAEVALVQESLGEIETERRLPLAKLLERGLCPACGTHSTELQRLAHKHANDSQCLVCGTAEESVDWQNLSSLHSQLSEKLRAQRALDERRRAALGQLQLAQREEDRLSLRVTARALKSPARIEPLSPTSDVKGRPRPTELRQRLVTAQETEALLLSEVKGYQHRLARSYSRFKGGIADRLEELRKLYAEYATAFLGYECSLVDVPNNDRLFRLEQLVPRFHGVVRHQPESCSEAQQFFLDIALRMAFISLSRTLSGEPATFLCETPENALDMSYVKNVATMFTAFAKERHSVVLTANIQEQGLYHHLLSGIKREQIQQRVLNLLDYGRLSKVHEAAVNDLRKHSPKI